VRKKQPAEDRAERRQGEDCQIPGKNVRCKERIIRSKERIARSKARSVRCKPEIEFVLRSAGSGESPTKAGGGKAEEILPHSIRFVAQS